MPDYSLPAHNTLVFGAGDCGKTTFAYRYLLNEQAACRFIFDEDGQAARRLGLRPCGTLAQCEAALLTRWVCFNPYLRWSADKLFDSFRWFAGWAYKVSQRGPAQHPKIFFVDEQWKVCDARIFPVELAQIVRTGRHHGLRYMTATHRPRDYHATLRSLVTEWVAFSMCEPDELKAVRDYWPGVERAAQLNKGEFIAYNVRSRSELAGKLF